MFRTYRVPLWLALMGLIAPAVVRADTPAAWPVLPVSTSASTAEATPTPLSSLASQISYEQDAAVPDAPQPDPGPSSGNNAPLASNAPGTGSTNACAACVASCCNCMGDCRQRCFFVGVEAALLAPITNHGGGTANYTLTNAGAGGAVSSYSTNSVNGMIVTPRIWMGLMGECWGVGVRYWRFDNSNGGGGPTNPGAGGNLGLFSANTLRLQTLDVEAIRRVCYCNHQVWLSGGFRYGQFVRNGSISGADVTGGTIFTGTAWTGTGFNGVGPTAALYGWKPIGCDGCWNLFYGGRVSYLWSDNSTAVAGTSAAFGNSVTSGGSANYGVNGGSANAFVGEANLGVQYNHALKCFPAIAFFRVAGEYQYWHLNNDFGAISTSTLSAGANAGSLTTLASTGNSTLGLLGFGISTGFMW